MSTLFGKPPSPPNTPLAPPPQNPELDAQAQANAQRRGQAASVFTQQNAQGSGGAKGSVFGK